MRQLPSASVDFCMTSPPYWNKREGHYAAYPEDLCKVPILATCPPDGVAVDPFCGTGTTNLAAMHLFHKSVGIDVSENYIEMAKRRCMALL